MVDKEGPIYDFTWSPTSREFTVCYGCELAKYLHFPRSLKLTFQTCPPAHSCSTSKTNRSTHSATVLGTLSSTSLRASCYSRQGLGIWLEEWTFGISVPGTRLLNSRELLEPVDRTSSVPIANTTVRPTRAHANGPLAGGTSSPRRSLPVCASITASRSGGAAVSYSTYIPSTLCTRLHGGRSCSTSCSPSLLSFLLRRRSMRAWRCTDQKGRKAMEVSYY